MVLVPRPRIEIAQLLVLHLVELGIDLDHLIVGVAVERRDVVAGPEPHRPPDDRDVLLAEQIAGALQMREIAQLERDVCMVPCGPVMKFTVWWSALQRMKTKKSSIQSEP